MAKETIPFSDFVQAAGAEHSDFILAVHEYMLEQNCAVEIRAAKSGYVVSYVHRPGKRTVANYVFRKKGPVLRVYADGVPAYQERLESWPDSMKAEVRKAGPCKRMLDASACNSRCRMGFDFMLGGERQQKCRNNAFMFFLNEQTKPYLEELLKLEMQAANT